MFRIAYEGRTWHRQLREGLTWTRAHPDDWLSRISVGQDTVSRYLANIDVLTTFTLPQPATQNVW